MVRGLTNYVRTNNLLRPHQLYNTHLVIDGKNISFQLFIDQSHGREFFCGNYDSYAQCVTTFFEALFKCDITPIVVFDGNNEKKKLNTNYIKYGNRLIRASKYKPSSADPEVYPLFLRTIFMDIAHKLNVFLYKCDFAADNDIANLARELNCPVLSLDSDYFIYDVLYVPFDTLIIKPQEDRKDQFFLACDLYSCKYFLNMHPGLRWEHLPLLATISGNDYIKSGEFGRFYKMLSKQRGRAAHMRLAINYLQNKSFEVAVRGVLNSMGGQHIEDEFVRRIAENILGYKYIESTIPNTIGLKIAKMDESLKTDACSTLDSLVADAFPANTLPNETLQDVYINDKLPDWFMQKSRTCVYPPPIFEIAKGIVYFLPAVLEDFSIVPVHTISLKIITALNKILAQTIKDKEEPLDVAGRHDSMPMVRKYTLDTYNKDIISLEDIPSLSKERRLDVLLDVLEFKSEKDALLSTFKELPSDWHLFFLCAIYWRRNAKSVIINAHLRALYLCAVTLKVIDTKISPERSLDDLSSKYADLLDDTIPSQLPECTTFDDLLHNVSKGDCALALRDLIPLFNYEPCKEFNKQILHSFGEFQSCAYFINALNSLLDEPLDKLRMAEFYNETFLYKAYHEMSSTNEEDATVALIAIISSSPILAQVCVHLHKLHLNISKT